MNESSLHLTDSLANLEELDSRHQADNYEAPDLYIWHQLVDRLVVLFRLSAEEERRIRINQLLRMLSLLPRFAGCKNPEGTGLLMACTYIAERRVARDLFAHKPENDDDVLSRLEPFSRLLEGGDPEIIEKGLNLAALTMIKDYAADADDDQSKGKYNPVAQKRWDWRKIAASIIRRNDEITHPVIDGIYGPDIALKSWWVI